MPEITSAVTALVRHDQHVGAGVVIGSNVFNLAALLGLSAVVAGEITLHRRVIELGGGVALWIAATALLVVTGVCSPLAGLLAGAGRARSLRHDPGGSPRAPGAHAPAARAGRAG